MIKMDDFWGPCVQTCSDKTDNMGVLQIFPPVGHDRFMFFGMHYSFQMPK